MPKYKVESLWRESVTAFQALKLAKWNFLMSSRPGLQLSLSSVVSKAIPEVIEDGVVLAFGIFKSTLKDSTQSVCLPVRTAGVEGKQRLVLKKEYFLAANGFL